MTERAVVAEPVVRAIHVADPAAWPAPPGFDSMIVPLVVSHSSFGGVTIGPGTSW